MTYLHNLILASQPKRPAVGLRVLALVVGVLFGGGGIALLISTTLTPIIKNTNASNWLPTPAIVTGCGLDNSSDRHGDTYQIAISYTYTHNNEPLQGNRYSFNQDATNIGVGSMEKIIASHPKGSPLTIYINPEDPSESVVSRKLPLLTYLGIPFSIPFLTVGITGIGFALFSPTFYRRFLKIREEISPLTELTETPLIHKLLNEPKLPDHRELFFLPGEKSKQILTGTFIALFVNGIVASFIFIMIVELLTGGGIGIFLAIFLIPFVLVGTKMLLTILKIRKTTNPPELLIAAEVTTTSSDQPQVTIEWLNLNKTTPKTLGFKTLHKPNTLNLSKIFKRTPPIDKSAFHLIPKEQLNTGSIQLPIQRTPDKKSKNLLAGSTIEILYKTINTPTQTLELQIVPHPNEG